MSTDIEAIRHLLAQYVGQLTQGCGNESCREPSCNTGRRNTAPSGRTVRVWTTRSARAIALTLVGGRAPRRHVCQYYASRPHESQAEDHERDPASFEQLLCDTDAIKYACSSVGPAKVCMRPFKGHLDALKPLKHIFNVEFSPPNSLPTNEEAADVLCDAVQACLEGVPKGPAEQYAYADRWIRDGSAFPNQNTQTPADSRWNIWLAVLDSFERQDTMRLLTAAMGAFSARVNLEDSLLDLKRELGSGMDETGGATEIVIGEWISRPLPGADISSLLIKKLEDKVDPTHMLALIVWLKKLFLLSWNGGTVVSGAALGALLLIASFYHLSVLEILRNIKLFSLPAVASRVDMVEMAESWMRHAPGHGTGRHLLSFGFLFEAKERSLYFRTINHLRMQSAHSASERSAALRRRVAPRTLEHEPKDQLKFDEEHYVLLNVSRTNVLEDAFDQLWQRQESELLRPLRVRLGEVEELEIGHDLGGVQIEFFNLVCKDIFADQAQMFTSDTKTGLSYFRPGSLQPLYMFELFGLLLALAIYNGVTLPVSFPLVFYKVLLDGHAAITLEDLWDGWRSDVSSLKYILDTDGADEDLDWLFPMEANGLRLFTIPSNSSASSLENHIRLRVARAIPTEYPAPAKTEIAKLDWPGWLLEDAMHYRSPMVTNKAKYAEMYARWLAFGCVEPQINAFCRGFGKVIKPHHLRVLPLEQLKSCVEGSTHLDLRELRRATGYEGYEPNGGYIKMFWRVVGSWREEKQMQLLKFVTAAERVPVGGARDITFVIQQAMMDELDDEAPLPTSSTCFGTLQLPKYSSAEVLDKKLSLAIKYGMEGFGTA